jgi:hypothetical protein
MEKVGGTIAIDSAPGKGMLNGSCDPPNASSAWCDPPEDCPQKMGMGVRRAPAAHSMNRWV